MTRDSLGRKLAVDDVVTFANQFDSSVDLGRVIRFTPQFIVLRSIPSGSVEPGYQPGRWNIERRKPQSLTLVSDQMRHLEDGEIFLHFKQIGEQA